jgi:parallel beta-helix repeat protein
MTDDTLFEALINSVTPVVKHQIFHLKKRHIIKGNNIVIDSCIFYYKDNGGLRFGFGLNNCTLKNNTFSGTYKLKHKKIKNCEY